MVWEVLSLRKKGQVDGPKIMLCAHMDEIGFIVRSITSQGQIILMNVGWCKPLVSNMQKVRSQQQAGRKIHGIIQSEYQDGKAVNMYVDLGAQCAEDVYALV